MKIEIPLYVDRNGEELELTVVGEVFGRDITTAMVSILEVKDGIKSWNGRLNPTELTRAHEELLEYAL